MSGSEEPPPILRIPAELRLNIYKLLLLDETDPAPISTGLESLSEYHDYERSSERAWDGRSLCFRNTRAHDFEDKHKGKLRTAYKIRTDRFRARCMDVTYACHNVPDICTAILCANKQIHDEAAHVLYSSYNFDFDTNIEACVPFLADLTPGARRCIRRVSFVKRAIPYDKDFDRCEWKVMCDYIANNLNIGHLDLGIVGGLPKRIAGMPLLEPQDPFAGWSGVQPFQKNEFSAITRMDEMSWVQQVVGIKSLTKLDIRACIEHCPPPTSRAMEFFVAFSASIENGFTEYIGDLMTRRLCV